MAESGRSKVYVIKTDNREKGIEELIDRIGPGMPDGSSVAIKANYNSADPFPASTHPGTLSAIVDCLNNRGMNITVAERSGMGVTREVLNAMGISDLSKKHGFDLVVLDQLDRDGWIGVRPENSHWKRGFLFAKLFRDADAIVQTCCLKAHRFGGHFTMSLKNSVGMVAKYDPDDDYNYMGELHSSKYQRQMIAEINTVYCPALVIMDGIKGFSHGGPDTGTTVEPGILLASKDRVAIDAAGVAVLRSYGTTEEVSHGPIFELDQIARAVELGIGVSGPRDMEVIPINDRASDVCEMIENELSKGQGKSRQTAHA